MGMFEYIAVLTSIIIGLGITQLLQGFTRLVQHPEHGKVYWVHLSWVIYMFLAVSLSADGTTLAVGAMNAGGLTSGSIYVFRLNGVTWSQQAFIRGPLWYGATVSLSADGNTLATGAAGENSGATGIIGDQSDKSAPGSGAACVYRFNGTDWLQQPYVKASNTNEDDRFGDVLMLSADGNTLAVTAIGEDSIVTGINGDQNDNSAGSNGLGVGATYVFRFDGMDWSQQAYIKASNTDFADASGNSDNFGFSAALSADSNALAVGAVGEDSNAVGIGGNQNDDSAIASGAVHLY